MWAVIRAPTPNRFTCPHCRERLWYRGIGGVLVVFSVLLVTLIAAALGAAWAVGSENPILAAAVGLAVLVLGYVLFEVSYALVLRYGDYQLESARSAREWDDEDAF
jgi:hypothetical protein